MRLASKPFEKQYHAEIVIDVHVCGGWRWILTMFEDQPGAPPQFCIYHCHDARPIGSLLCRDVGGEFDCVIDVIPMILPNKNDDGDASDMDTVENEGGGGASAASAQ